MITRGGCDTVLGSPWHLKGNFHNVQRPCCSENEGAGSSEIPCSRTPFRWHQLDSQMEQYICKGKSGGICIVNLEKLREASAGSSCHVAIENPAGTIHHS